MYSFVLYIVKIWKRLNGELQQCPATSQFKNKYRNKYCGEEEGLGSAQRLELAVAWLYILIWVEIGEIRHISSRKMSYWWLSDIFKINKMLWITSYWCIYRSIWILLNTVDKMKKQKKRDILENKPSKLVHIEWLTESCAAGQTVLTRSTMSAKHDHVEVGGWWVWLLRCCFWHQFVIFKIKGGEGRGKRAVSLKEEESTLSGSEPWGTPVVQKAVV